MNNENYVYDFEIELSKSPKKHLMQILDNIEKIINILDVSSVNFSSNLDAKLFLLQNKNEIYMVLNGVNIESMIEPLSQIISEKSKTIELKIDACSISSDRRIYLDTVGLVDVCDKKSFSDKLNLNKSARWNRSFNVKKESGKYYVAIAFNQPLEAQKQKSKNKNYARRCSNHELSSTVFLKVLKALARPGNGNTYKTSNFSRLSGHKVSGGLPGSGRNR